MQLNTTFSVGTPFPTASQLYLSTFQFIVPESTIYITALWFASLICALITASLGILVKRWLRNYMMVGDMKPDQLFRVRY